MPKKLAVLGSINADHVITVPYFAKPGETLMGRHYHIAYGGKGANQAVAAARLGAKVDFIACIGNDDIGHTMKTAFAQEGINTQPISTIETQTTGIAMIQVAENGENSIVISAGANACLDEHIVQQQAQIIAQADYLLIQLETPLSAVKLAINIAQTHHTKVILNPAPACPLPDELLGCVNIITPNETETELLTGINVTDQQTASQAAQIFHQKGIATVIITLGSKGVYLSENGKGEWLKGFCVNAVDTTAAGDTFNGGLVAALLENQPISYAIHFAQAAAAISVTRQGAQPSIPTRQETLTFLADPLS